MELILFYIEDCKDLIISFLILMFIIGIICFLGIRNFNQNSRTKVAMYGLFSKMNVVDILKVSSVVIRSFLAIYAIIITNQIKIVISLIMIIELTLMYILFTPKRILYEVISSIISISMIYFIYILNSYSVQVEDLDLLILIKVFFMVFVSIYTIYMFFKEIYIITKDREKIGGVLNENQKEKIK